MAGGLAAQARVLQQPDIKGRHPHHHCGGRKAAEDFLNVELGQQDDGSARRQADIDRHEQAVDVEDRQGVQQHIIMAEMPKLTQHFGIGPQVAVGEHGALGNARGAGGVKNAGQITLAQHSIGKVRRLACSLFQQTSAFAIIA